MVLSVVALVAALASCCCPFAVGCSTFCFSRGSYFHRLRANLETLEENMESLNDLVKKIRDTPHTPQQDHNNARWFQSVEKPLEKALKKAKEAQTEIKNKFLRWFCPKHFCSFKGLETELRDLSNKLEDLKQKGEDILKELHSMLSVPEKRPIVGLQSLVKQIEEYLSRSSVQIVGIYDTQRSAELLKEINQQLTRTNFVVISFKVGNLEDKTQVQEAISRKLQLHDDKWENQSQDERCSLRNNSLGGQKFVLLLDGLSERWEHSDLSRIGIPLGSKIIITAPIESVFEKMKVDVRVEADLLTPDNALALSKSFAEPLPLDMARLAASGGVVALPLSKSLAEPHPLDMARLATLAEGPMTIGIILVNWVLPQDLTPARNYSRPNRRLVEFVDAHNCIKHSPY